MPVNLRAAALRDALERAVGEPVHMTADEGVTRLHAPAPDGADTDRWQRIITALSAADRWGSTEEHGAPEIWAEITEGQA